MVLKTLIFYSMIFFSVFHKFLSCHISKQPTENISIKICTLTLHNQQLNPFFTDPVWFIIGWLNFFVSHYNFWITNLKKRFRKWSPIKLKIKQKLYLSAKCIFTKFLNFYCDYRYANKEYYLEVLWHLREVIRRKCPDLFGINEMLLQYFAPKKN